MCITLCTIQHIDYYPLGLNVPGNRGHVQKNVLVCGRGDKGVRPSEESHLVLFSTVNVYY